MGSRSADSMTSASRIPLTLVCHVCLSLPEVKEYLTRPPTIHETDTIRVRNIAEAATVAQRWRQASLLKIALPGDTVYDPLVVCGLNMMKAMEEFTVGYEMALYERNTLSTMNRTKKSLEDHLNDLEGLMENTRKSHESTLKKAVEAL